MSDERKEPGLPDEIDLLLPWHATGRLSAAEAGRVREALTRDPDLARRLALVEEERAETVALNETLGVPSNRARDRLFERIQAEGARRHGPAAGGSWLARLVGGFAPRTLALATAALAVLALLQAGLLAALLVPGDARFTTASGPAAGAEGSYLLVAFAPGASAAEIEAFLRTRQATIVDGPRPGGLFRVRIGERRLSEADLAAAVAAMRAEARVVRLVMPSL